MKKQFSKFTGYTWLTLILILAFGIAGCGGNNTAKSEEPTEEILHKEEPTEEVIPTKEPTETVIPTEEPTETVVPTEEPTETVIPTAVPTDSVFYLPPIMGKYSVSGLDPDFNNYEGELEITASEGFFLWNWLDRARDGVGIYQEIVVTVAWLGGTGSGTCNAISFMIQEDGALIGLFTASDGGGYQLGKAEAHITGEMGEGIEGTYNFAASIFSGIGSAHGPLDITRDGDVYDFYMEHDYGKWYGVGIQRGDIVSFAYSHRKDKNCMVVSYLIEEDGTLDGVWAYIAGTELSTDVAIPETLE